VFRHKKRRGPKRGKRVTAKAIKWAIKTVGKNLGSRYRTATYDGNFHNESLVNGIGLNFQNDGMFCKYLVDPAGDFLNKVFTGPEELDTLTTVRDSKCLYKTLSIRYRVSSTIATQTVPLRGWVYAMRFHPMDNEDHNKTPTFMETVAGGDVVNRKLDSDYFYQMKEGVHFHLTDDKRILSWNKHYVSIMAQDAFALQPQTIAGHDIDALGSSQYSGHFNLRLNTHIKNHDVHDDSGANVFKPWTSLYAHKLNPTADHVNHKSQVFFVMVTSRDDGVTTADNRIKLELQTQAIIKDRIIRGAARYTADAVPVHLKTSLGGTVG